MEEREIEVGQQVVFVDSRRQWHQSLVTAVWSGSGSRVENPCINLVFVSGDTSKADQYGRQIERETSVVHYGDSTAPGQCWLRSEESDDASAKFAEAEKGVKV